MRPDPRLFLQPGSPPAPGGGLFDGRLLPRWLAGPVRRWQAVVITVIWGPIALVGTIGGFVGLVVAPPFGVALLFGTVALWTLVILPWWLLRVQRREAASRTTATSSRFEVRGELDWRAAVASLASGTPKATAVQLSVAVAPSQSSDLRRHALSALAGLRDAGAIDVAGLPLEALTAELTTAEDDAQLSIALVRPEVVAAQAPPARATVTVASPVSAVRPDPTTRRQWQSQVEQAGSAPGAAGPVFVDIAVREGGDPEDAIAAVVGGLERHRAGGQARIAWLRWQRLPGLPAGLVVSIGPCPPLSDASSERSVSERFALFDEPRYAPIPLAVAPRLESWDRADHPSQIALRHYLDALQAAVSGRMDAPAGHDLAIRLAVGVPAGKPLAGTGGDLDNYLLPVVRRLGAGRFASAWAIKHHGHSSVCIEPARRTAEPAPGTWAFAEARPTGSAQARAWKQQIAEQVPHVPAPDGHLELQLCFRVGPERNWTTLWKPAIDALGGILGQDPRGRPFNPRDDRVTRLGLHRVVDPEAGHEVAIGIWWRLSPRDR